MNGESSASICVSLDRSKPWLYKWLARYDPDSPDWFRDLSRRPLISPHRTEQELEEAVKLTRLSLYNRGLFYGAQAILWELEDQGVRPLPAPRTVNRILSRNDLTHRRTGRYEPKGTPYPVFPAETPNHRHQADFVGPRHLQGPGGVTRFHSLNVIDLATGRCGTHPLLNKAGNAIYEAFWAIWNRLGMPCHLQVDNEAVFYGS
ncbi:MAG: helix-turn-helix domain-containing protein, partial [bacterium]|nr:helix-turn-helix domain-containing protein [bacterium]